MGTFLDLLIILYNCQKWLPKQWDKSKLEVESVAQGQSVSPVHTSVGLRFSLTRLVAKVIISGWSYCCLVVDQSWSCFGREGNFLFKITWCLKGTQDKKKVPFKCLTFPKSSRRAGSEYVKFELFRWGPSEKIYVLYVAMAEKALSSGRKWFLRWFSPGFGG